ncbi:MULTISPECIES: hypothetical protein [unclassified Variovorax]|uniref:hypothetical protein n=1 Tax=unclassified Variovorax TaxID=663243 RepID=UPI00076C03CA|nr:MULTISPECIES: hypothetical protein [unclassified Variovorax]KWT70826.1 hypothetical protein APY03_6582 [Variovorax sp. WDL1]PNG49193.1 hypothetical protein CHC06_06430 [Variovorax sp. B2]PNG49578.1 hypothetical protein CHC07_06487 [Variovorax sp. B4]VTV18760.1 hypothetical protein WDL1P2_00410 [Variovorax sp. WDL1]
MTSAPLVFARTLNAWLKSDDKKLLAAINGGRTIEEASEELQREPVSVLRRISDIGAFEFELGTEEWVEIMSLALSGVPLQDVMAWCSASDDRMPYELLDAMRSGPDQRPAFELARELSIVVPTTAAVADLVWLVEQPEEIRSGYAAAAQKVAQRFDALTPASLKSEMLGIAPAELVWMGGPAPKARRGSATGSARTAKTRAPRKASTSRARKPKIRNRWAFANYMKKKRASAS